MLDSKLIPIIIYNMLIMVVFQTSIQVCDFSRTLSQTNLGISFVVVEVLYRTRSSLAGEAVTGVSLIHDAIKVGLHFGVYCNYLHFFCCLSVYHWACLYLLSGLLHVYIIVTW